MNVSIEITNYRYDTPDGEPETISYRVEGTCRNSNDVFCGGTDFVSDQILTVVKTDQRSGKFLYQQGL